MLSKEKMMDRLTQAMLVLVIGLLTIGLVALYEVGFGVVFMTGFFGAVMTLIGCSYVLVKK